MKPRGWQEEAFEKFISSDNKSFLVEATPGAGKTIFSAFCADYLLKNDVCDFVVCVVPTTALKGDESAGFLGDYNKIGPQITTVLRDKKPAPREFSGGVVTYSQLPNIVGTFETWRRQGKRLFFVFDEIHHASESNVWGSATERCGAIAERILAMTGTPFRGDGQRISFVRYNGSGEVVADYAYAYRQAVADDVCRPVLFVHDDGTASYIFEEKEEVEISKARDDQVGKVQGTIFRRGSEFLTGVLSKADAKLDEYRLTAPSAGGIIICRPGINDDDDRHVLEVAKALQELTGEAPTVITHDDKDANAKIDRFRRSQDRWIVSVRKVSEGVDIKRLRVMVLATHPGTELLFRQLVGRVVRVIDKTANEDSTVYMAKFPRLVEFASRIEDEAQQGLKLKTEKQSREVETGEQSKFIPIASTHVDGGAISSLGEMYEGAEIRYAEELKRTDRHLASTSVAAIAYLLRKHNFPIPDAAKQDRPLQVVKKERRNQIAVLLRKVATAEATVNNRWPPDYRGVAMRLWRAVGVKSLDDLMDNHSLDKCDVAIDVASRWLVESEHDAA